MRVICAKCGRPVDPDEPCCPYCATTVTARRDGELEPPRPAGNDNTSSTRGTVRYWSVTGWRGWLAVAVVCAVVVAGIVFFLLPLLLLGGAVGMLWWLLRR